MKKILLVTTTTISFLFSGINFQTASKKELMCIKGIGEKKAEAIINYRKSNKIKSADDLLKLKGFGKALIAKIKNGEKTIKCGGKKYSKQKDKKKVSNEAKTEKK